MAYVLDAGALIAADRRDVRLAALLAVAARSRHPIRTSTATVAQVWRDGVRQAALSRLLHATVEYPLDGEAARRVGELLRQSKTSDIADAHIANICRPGDVLLTSDPDDLSHLLETCPKPVRTVTIYGNSMPFS